MNSKFKLCAIDGKQSKLKTKYEKRNVEEKTRDWFKQRKEIVTREEKGEFKIRKKERKENYKRKRTYWEKTKQQKGGNGRLGYKERMQGYWS